MIESVRSIDIDRIDVGRRLRAHVGDDYVRELAESIRDAGLVNPITVAERDGRYRLVAGLHRLDACRSLGWPEVPAHILDADDVAAELAEIEENLRRRELSVLERGEHLVRRSEILKAKGVRAARGRPRKGASDAPLSTTGELAKQAGVAERTAQQGMQIARALPAEVRDVLRPTAHAGSARDLLELAKIEKPEKQLDVAKVLASGDVDSVYGAIRAVENRYNACAVCGAVLDGYEFHYRRPEHCAKCGEHFAPDLANPWSSICGRCGTAVSAGRPISITPAPPLSPADPVPGPFYRKGGHRGDARVALPIPDEGNDGAPKASDLALRFADAADALMLLDAEALAREIDSPVVRLAAKKLGHWFDKFRLALEPAQSA